MISSVVFSDILLWFQLANGGEWRSVTKLQKAGMDKEGVIKFELLYTPAPPLPGDRSRAIRHWHQRCHALGLIGRDKARYGGYAYGNISQRHEEGFLISGTQTGGKPMLAPEDICLVTAWDIARNQVRARGPVRPSSESLSHAMLYQLDPAIGFVIHVHDPSIWLHAHDLGLPTTPAEIAYGTPAMADAVEQCYRQAGLNGSGVIAMGGHEDGILAFGVEPDQAGELLLDCHHRAQAVA